MRVTLEHDRTRFLLLVSTLGLLSIGTARLLVLKLTLCNVLAGVLQIGALTAALLKSAKDKTIAGDLLNYSLAAIVSFPRV